MQRSLIAVALLAALACGDSALAPVPPSISVTAASANLVSLGETTQLTAKDENGAAVAKPITWTSSSNSVATVSASGVVTAVANGTATITAKVDSLTASTTITVAQAPAKLAFLTKPMTTQFGVVIPAFAVQVRDANDNLVPTATNAITVAIDVNPANGVLSGTTQVNASGGAALFGTLAIDKAAVGYTFTATAPGLPAATSQAFEIMDVGLRIDSVKLSSANVKIGGSAPYSVWITNGSGQTLTFVAVQGYLQQGTVNNGAGGASVVNCGSATAGTIIPGTCKMDWALYATQGSYIAGAATAKIDLHQGTSLRGSKSLAVTMTP